MSLRRREGEEFQTDRDSPCVVLTDKSRGEHVILFVFILSLKMCDSDVDRTSNGFFHALKPFDICDSGIL